ncbi:STAS domain-containing protein [Streptomyces sp. NPDC002886]|uniref:STAS domain-containing protein n=1 Tax=Streptomyces sp. NPDC002886 TaxID=3364667 RepID=UPI003676F0A3
MAEHPDRGTAGSGIAVEVLDQAVAVRPTGEIDIDTAPALHFALTEALAHATPAKDVVLDCSGITFCDSSGLNALLAVRRQAQQTNTVIRLAAPNAQLQRILEITGTLPLFPQDQDPPPADALPPPRLDELPQ